MADHYKTAMIHVLLGFEVAILGYLNMDGSDEGSVEIVCTLGIVLYIVAIIAVVSMQQDNKIGVIVVIILCLLAGIY